MKKINYLIKEIPATYSDFTFYFDDDGLSEKGGDFCYTLFIIYDEGYGRKSGLNIDTYKKITDEADEIISCFDDIKNGYREFYASYKAVMEDYKIPYSAKRCHDLKEWAARADANDDDDIAEYLTIKTGRKWDTGCVRGYCQGDYVDIVYCPEFYSGGIEAYGEVYLGCAKEFSITYLNESYDIDDESLDYDIDDASGDTVYGYIVADCQANTDDDYKKLVCDMEGIPEEETVLQMIDGYSTHTIYSYRTA